MVVLWALGVHQGNEGHADIQGFHAQGKTCSPKLLTSHLTLALTPNTPGVLTGQGRTGTALPQPPTPSSPLSSPGFCRQEE